MFYEDRRHAGRSLARALSRYEGRPNVVVLALPRGGVPVADEVAGALHAPLDVFVVRKLGFPGHDEFAMGAIASGGIRVLDLPLIRRYGISSEEVADVAAREEVELRRRERLYRGDGPRPPLAGRIVILVDDGLATGASMRAAVEAVRTQDPARIVVAVPVGPRETVRDLSRVADEVVCVATPDPFLAVGRFYANFDQTTDEEVFELLARARARELSGAALAAGGR
jgi:predicted phosphoribosyltransferase